MTVRGKLRWPAPRWTSLLLIVIIVGGAVAFRGLEDRLSVGGFLDPGSQSSKAHKKLADGLDGGVTNLVVVVRSPVDVTTESIADPIQRFEADLEKRPGVASVASYFSSGQHSLISSDKLTAVLLTRLSGSEDQVRSTITELQPMLKSGLGDARLSVKATGQAEILREVSDESRRDLVRAEAIAIPITFVLLLLFFGNFYAALIPVGLGALSSLLSVLCISILNSIMPISVYSLNLVTGLALGLSIDYSLLIVSRYREGLRAGMEYPEALELAVGRCRWTSGISASIVALCLAALLVIPLNYLRSLAIAGIVVVAAVSLFTVWLVPRAIRAIGPRIGRQPAAQTQLDERSRLVRFLQLVERYRVSSIVLSLIILGVLLSPIANLRLGPVDDRVLPADASARSTADFLRDEMPALSTDPLIVYASSTERAVEDYASRLSSIPGVDHAVDARNTYVDGARVLVGNPALQADGATAVEVYPTAGLKPATTQDVAQAVREMPAPFDTAVAGLYSADIDTQRAITDRIPFVLLIVALAMLPLLFLLTGGILVSIKALVLTAVSLAASFGAMVFVFQEGNFSGVLNFTATGTVDATAPILMFCLAFGLSMDYQVFLLARIREEFDKTGDNAASVVTALARTARVITSAAVLIAVVFLAIGTSGISFVKLLGVGLALAVLLDAFLVRLVLVPSLMLLLGNANWWAPAGMLRVRARVDRALSGGSSNDR